jgi:hypothetical protein
MYHHGLPGKHLDVPTRWVRPLGQQWRERARRQRAAEDAVRLAGRLRYATRQALEGAARAWAWDVEDTWRSLAAAMAAAVERSENRSA